MKEYNSIKELESWIDSYLNFEKTPEKNIFWLDTMKFFCEKFSHPEGFAPCFHVAGSKGKGSVSTFIASILDEAGYKTGIYTSPHITDFIERVSSAKGPFTEEVYSAAVKELMTGVKSIKDDELPGRRPITWFELVTLFSFLVFRKAEVDYSVFEVGLGGRLDSTNVVFPMASVITPIELEHTEFLGDTLEKIAYEKGGIIKKKTPVIIAGQKAEVRKVFEKIAGEKESEAIFLEDAVKELKFSIKNISDCIFFYNNFNDKPLASTASCINNYTASDKKINIPLMSVSFKLKDFESPVCTDLLLPGSFQAENAALAALAVKTVLPSVSKEVIERGLSRASLPGRFEVIPNPMFLSSSAGKANEKVPFVILDGAHTVNSVGFTLETMKKVFGNQKRILLFACAADKDVTDIAPLFKNEFDKIFLTKPGSVKKSDLTSLTQAFDSACLPYECSEDYESQIKKALAFASAENALLLITGSFYLIAEVKKILTQKCHKDVATQ